MEQKKTLSARQIASEIKSGATDDELKLKYNLTTKDLQTLFGKLLEAGLVTQAELEQRPTRFDDRFDLDFEDEGPVNNGVSVSEITSDTHDTEGLVESSQSQTTPYMGGQSKESKLTSERSDDVRKQEVESSSKPAVESPTVQLVQEQIAAGNVITSCSDTELSSIGGQSNEPKLTSDNFSSENIETIVLVFVLPPLGLYRLWKSSQFKQILKVVLTAITTIIWLIILWGSVMVIMSMLLFLLVFVFFICLILGMIKPSIFSRFLRGEVTRKKTATIFTIATVVSFVLFGITVENTPKTEKQKSKSEPSTENTLNQVKQSNSAEKPAKESQPSRVRELPQQATSPTPDKIEKTPQVEAKKSNRSQESNQVMVPPVPEKPKLSQQVPEEVVTCADAQECFNTGLKYYNSQNYSEAFRWYSKAADQGNVEAQKALASMYYGGKGVNPDYAETLKWNRKAADQGDAEAQKRLGLMYYNGIGVTEDLAEATNWYRKSSDQGDTDARVLLERADQVLQTEAKKSQEPQPSRVKELPQQVTSPAPEKIENSPKSEPKKSETFQESKHSITPSVPEKTSSPQQISEEDVRVFNEDLFRAVDRDDIEGVTFCLDKGAKINAKSSKGGLILMEAYKPEMVRLLLDKGADVNAKTYNGWTALMSVCSRFCFDTSQEKEKIEKVRLLLDRGADVNAKSTNTGTTPLLQACESDSPIEVIKLLLDRGAKTNVEDRFGYSALKGARIRPELSDLLKAYGAKE